MKRLPLIWAILLFGLGGCGANWTTERAKEEAFRNVQTTIDVSAYPARDPDFEENQQALRAGREQIGDRFVTASPEPYTGYVVSKLGKNNRPPRSKLFFTEKRGH